MFERFTDRARHVLVLAQEEARLLSHNFIGTEHLLLGLIREGESLGAKALESLGVSLDDARAKVRGIGPSLASGTSSPAFTPRAKKALELSLREALQLGHNYVGAEHMILGLVREGEGAAADVLEALGVELPVLRQQVLHLLSGYSDRSQRHDSGFRSIAYSRGFLNEEGARVALRNAVVLTSGAAELQMVPPPEPASLPTLLRTQTCLSAVLLEYLAGLRQEPVAETAAYVTALLATLRQDPPASR